MELIVIKYQLQDCVILGGDYIHEYPFVCEFKSGIYTIIFT